MRRLARSLSGTTVMPRQDPCRGPGKTVAGDIGRAAARPTSAKAPPPFPYSCQPNQLGRHLRGNVRLPDRLSKHLRGGMQIFVKTLPQHQLSSLPAYMALHATLAWTRVAARRGGDNKKACRQRIKCVCPTPPEDRLSHRMHLPPPVCHCGIPFFYKRRPKEHWRGIRLFGLCTQHR